MSQGSKRRDKQKGSAYSVGFDLGGSKMLAAVIDGRGRVVSRQRTKTNGNEGVEAGLAQIKKTIRKALGEAEVEAAELACIGVGCPGPVDQERGILLEAPNLGWQDVRLRKLLEAEFGCPIVVVNDVDAGLFGEYRQGAAREAHTAVGIFPGTGIGGACVYEGQLLRGRDRSCMEIGHIQVAPEGPLCGCGRRGCLEAVAGRLAIAGAAAQAAYRGDAPYLLDNCGTDLANIRSRALARLIVAGDEAVEEILNNAARHIGRALAGVLHLLAADVVVLGGGLVEAMPKLFVKGVHQAARQRVMPAFADSFAVVAAELGDDSTVVGAAGWAAEVMGRPRGAVTADVST